MGLVCEVISGRGNRRGRVFDGAWLAFWVALSTAWCAGEAYRLGATFDDL
jgi:hypothetical protein